MSVLTKHQGRTGRISAGLEGADRAPRDPYSEGGRPIFFESQYIPEQVWLIKYLLNDRKRFL